MAYTTSGEIVGRLTSDGSTLISGETATYTTINTAYDGTQDTIDISGGLYVSGSTQQYEVSRSGFIDWIQEELIADEESAIREFERLNNCIGTNGYRMSNQEYRIICDRMVILGDYIKKKRREREMGKVNPKKLLINKILQLCQNEAKGV